MRAKKQRRAVMSKGKGINYSIFAPIFYKGAVKPVRKPGVFQAIQKSEEVPAARLDVDNLTKGTETNEERSN